MENFVYIKKSIAGHFVDFAEPLKAEEYNNLGETIEDYNQNKWVLLNSSQVEFLENNPGASVYEVWNMQLDPAPVIDELAEAKNNKLMEIEAYDTSSSVNSFTISGQEMWLNVEERQQLATQISANEAIGRESMTRWFNGVSFTFPIAQWKQMLVALEVYAGDALNVTEAHKAAVNALTTVADVEAYDYTANYPEKLSFNS